MSLDAPQPGLFEDCRTAIKRREILCAPGLYRNHETPPPPVRIFVAKGDAPVHPPRPLEAPDDLWRALNPGDTCETMMGSAQPAGNVGMRDAAFFVTGDVRIGGGARAEADNLRVFAKGGIPGSGDLDWGRPESFGDAGQVTVHLLAEGPGWAAGARTTRVVTARRPRRVRAGRPDARRRRPFRRDAAGPDLAGREQDPAQLRHADARRP